MFAPRLSKALTLLLFLSATTAHATLETAWTYRLYEPGGLEKGVKEFGQPIFAKDGQLILAPGRDGHLWAFDTQSQKVVWKRKFTNRLIAHPALVSKDSAIVADTGGEIRMISLTDGTDLWESSIRTQGSYHGRIMIHGPIFSALDSANRLIAATLTGKFLFDIGQQEGRGFDLFSECTPATDGKAIFVGFSNGNVASVHPIKGTINWEREIPQNGERVHDIQAGPIVFGNHLVVGGPGAGLHVLNKETGVTSSTLKLPGLVQLIPAAENQAYALTWRGELSLISINTDGQAKQLWEASFPGVPGPTALTDRSLLFCNGSGLISLSRKDGHVQSYRKFAEGCASGVATTNGQAAIISANGELVVWRVLRP